MEVVPGPLYFQQDPMVCTRTPTKSPLPIYTTNMFCQRLYVFLDVVIYNIGYEDKLFKHVDVSLMSNSAIIMKHRWSRSNISSPWLWSNL